MPVPNTTCSSRQETIQQTIDVINKKAGCEIISFPGNGCKYMLEKTLNHHRENYQFINDLSLQNTSLKQINIVTIDSCNTNLDIDNIDKLFNKATSNKKFIIVIELPIAIRTQAYNSSRFSKHIYKKYYLSSRNIDETKELVNDLNPALTNKVDHIFSLSGGISRLIKLICNNTSLLTKKTLPSSVIPQIQSIYNSIFNCSSETLKRLSLTNTDNQFISQWLSQYQQNNQQKPNIQVNHNLTIIENCQTNPSDFSKIEIDIINLLLLNEIINRDQIATAKWGHLSDEKYSDEAINKTISRINAKLVSHKITSISRLGYKINLI